MSRIALTLLLVLSLGCASSPRPSAKRSKATEVAAGIAVLALCVGAGAALGAATDGYGSTYGRNNDGLYAALAASQATGGAPRVIASDGTYLGKLSSNEFDLESISNPYGKYGNEFSSVSVNNRYGKYGSEFSAHSINNPYAD